MARLLSPVCADRLNFHKHSNFFCSSNSSPILVRTNNPWSISGARKRCRKIRAVDEDFASQASAADDYYAVLGLLPDATPAQIKKAYYGCMKECHPDLSGDNPETTNFCMFINEVYEVLSDPVQRRVYDEIHGYALTAINPFLDDSISKDHAFVDEFSCIGCKNCANVAPDVFNIEEDFGRARVCNQFGDPDLVQQAIDSCPVDCIHWTSAAQLSLLEDEMRRVERVNVALMLAGMGASSDVFRMASSRWEKRQSKVLERARMRMMQQKDSNKGGSYWDDLWGMPKEYQNTDAPKGSSKRAGRRAPTNSYQKERATQAPTKSRRKRKEIEKSNVGSDGDEDYEIRLTPNQIEQMESDNNSGGTRTAEDDEFLGDDHDGPQNLSLLVDFNDNMLHLPFRITRFGFMSIFGFGENQNQTLKLRSQY